jgi:hypothetical protein
VTIISPVYTAQSMEYRADNSVDEGLKKNASTMSQIPTYVTGVPNGTEKVGSSTQGLEVFC